MRRVSLASLPPIVTTVSIALFAALVLAVVVGICAIRAPLLHPPGIGVRLELYLRTNVAQTSSDPVLPELAPLILRANITNALHEIALAGIELGWRELSVDEVNSQVRAVVVSSVFRFSDDLYIRLLDRGTQRTEALVRSSSRVGRGDLGANVHHIMALRDVLTRRALLVAEGGT
ncbi:MAG: hypothetical protein ACI8W7_000605 [Gammaproteobacteria bacterium]|jgi:uncharacterized protein (DUF1499 family)